MHSSETWAIKQNDKSKIQATDMTKGKIKRELGIRQAKSNREFTDFPACRLKSSPVPKIML
jgi:hypothetical protein